MKSILLAILFAFSIHSFAQLRVSGDKRYLVKDNKPFFWLGDTAWELFHRLSREEADEYLKDRASKGYTVIQAVILAEFDGLQVPNFYGDLPLVNRDPAKPNEKYFRHVDYIVNSAEKLGMYIGMLPSWGDKWNKKWGIGPEVFTPQNARTFGEYVGRRYKNNQIIWIMGGDRDCEKPVHFEIIRAMAEGLKKGDGGNHLFTFHPQGGKSSSDFFREDAWVDFHMSQTGHSNQSLNYKYNQKHLAMKPAKPHLDGEPRYEDHPNKFNPQEHGWMDDFDARQCAWWSMLSGGFGHTYGNHNIWQFYTEERKPVSWARTHWKVAIDHPGASQVSYMKRFLQQRPWQRLIPDTTLVTSENKHDSGHVVAAISQDNDFMMVYLPLGKKLTVSTSKIKSANLKAYWLNPRDGRSLLIGTMKNKNSHEFTPHSQGRGSDWVLLIEDPAKNFQVPGIRN